MKPQHHFVGPAYPAITGVWPSKAATASFKSDVDDCSLAWTVAYTIQLLGTSGASITAYLEGSNEPVPQGQTSISDWVVPDASFQQIYSGGIAVSLVMTTDGYYTIAADMSGLQFRWTRVRIVVGTPGGGTIQIAIFVKGGA